ncbi:hypothetical protein OJ998_15100 [Solirubrobacter taibaiensis]|nr:hypothetical protein [Solirubrobacter taibaiensis]
MKLLIGGGALAAIAVAVLTGVLLLGSGDTSLASAGEKLKGQNVRMQIAMEATMAGAETKMTGTAIQSADSTRVRMETDTTVAGQTQKQTIMVLGKDVFVGGSDLEAVLPDGKKWLHAEQNLMTGPAAMNFSEYAAFISKAENISEKGTEQIRGQRVTHYGGELNVKEMADAAKSEDMDRWMKMLDGQVKSFPIEIWVAEDGRPARIALDVAAAGEKMKMTMDILEYGVSLDSVQAPPKAEWITEEELQKQLQVSEG